MQTNRPPGISAKRAELAANAVLARPRTERAQAAARSTRLLVWLYPGLGRFPPLQRRRIFADARAAAYRNGWPARIVIALTGVGAVVFAWLNGSSHMPGLAWACAGLAIALQIVRHQVVVRRFIRRADPMQASADVDG